MTHELSDPYGGGFCPITQKSTGQKFIKDPDGWLWRLDDCEVIPNGVESLDRLRI